MLTLSSKEVAKPLLMNICKMARAINDNSLNP